MFFYLLNWQVEDHSQIDSDVGDHGDHSVTENASSERKLHNQQSDTQNGKVVVTSPVTTQFVWAVHLVTSQGNKLCPEV